MTDCNTSINPMSLKDKHIFITGASSGIGRSTAVAASKLGARLTLVARNAERLQETVKLLSGEVHGIFACELQKSESIEPMIKDAVAERGPLDGLVHCAGIGNGRPLKLCTQEYSHEMMEIHFFAFVELLRVASKKKNSNDGASFVGVSSVAAFRGGKSQEIYAAAKAAMDAVIHPVAKELATRRIRVNNAAFGMINTDMYRLFLESGGDPSELLRDQYLGVGEIEDAANVLCFLLSDASRFITGTTLIADGGMLS